MKSCTFLICKNERLETCSSKFLSSFKVVLAVVSKSSYPRCYPTLFCAENSRSWDFGPAAGPQAPLVKPTVSVLFDSLLFRSLRTITMIHYQEGRGKNIVNWQKYWSTRYAEFINFLCCGVEQNLEMTDFSSFKFACKFLPVDFAFL